MSTLLRLGNAVIHTINRNGAFLATSRLRVVDLDMERLLNEATRRTGLDDFGAQDYLQPLTLLLKAYASEAELSLVGRVAMREDVLRSLMIRLRITADRRIHPEIADTDIHAPIIITGLPRSGTTFLHKLLAEDPGFRAPGGWEVMYPSPPPSAHVHGSEPRIARAQKRMRELYWLAPSFKVIHPLDAASPQECIAITRSAFSSDVYPTMCHLPSYQHWLDSADLVPAYRYHRRFLQQLQNGQKNLRWLLKAPAHLFGLEALLQVYPDARIIFTHRDPLQAIPSLANLTMVLRSAFSDRHEPAEIGCEVTERWSKAMRRARQYVERLPDRDSRCLDISYADLIRQPLDAIARLYEHFDLQLSGATLDRMKRHLQQHPKDRFGKHSYSLDQFDLDAGKIERAFDGLDGYCN